MGECGIYPVNCMVGMKKAAVHKGRDAGKIVPEVSAMLSSKL